MAEEVELQQTGGNASLQGQFIELEVDGKIVNFKIKSIGDVQKDTTTGDIVMGKEKERTKTMEQIKEEEKTEEIFSLVPDSTNAWLYIDDSFQDKDTDKNGKIEGWEHCGDGCTNKFIAVFVLILQISAYIVMATFLGNSRAQEFDSRKENCYGPNCTTVQPACMELSTGGLTSILLVGFLWADVVNVLALSTRSCRWAIASCLVLIELITAIVCGFLVGVYSESNFDAIGGAVGILFVHDLDEKVFASMQVFRGQSYATLKKSIAIILWIVLSIVVAVVLACEYNDGTFFGQCKKGEYECTLGSECIWEGFVCNGVKDCKDASDEGIAAGCDYAAANYCPDDKFQCVEDGSCIDISKRCDGNLDCEEGSDEGRSQNCTAVIAAKKCGSQDFNKTDKYEGDDYYQVWSGQFKCNNGQCIDARFACDGQAGDCVDGSDEYPDFYKGGEFPFERSCPYARLIECDDDEVLCKISGLCIKKTSLCDGTKDCPDGQDETLCDYDCSSQVSRLESFQCSGQIAFLNSTHYQLFEPDLSGVTGNVTDADKFVKYESRAKLLETDIFDNSTGECIPIEWRCDGVNDCSDGSDEVECSLFSCSDDEYQCTDTGSCIPKSWLCDGVDDCDNKEDENKAICVQNGASVSSNGCVDQGYFYECSNYADICIYNSSLCDGFQDCPFNDDEDPDTCAAARAAASSGGSGSTGGTAECGGTLSGSGYQDDLHSYSFTMPAGQTSFKLSTCLTENQGETWVYMYDSAGTQYIYSNYDSECGCPYRSVILGQSTGADGYNTYTVTPGTTYTIDMYQYYTGNYAIKIECGTSNFAEGGTCSGGNVGSIGGGFNPYSTYFNSYSTSSPGNTGMGGTGTGMGSTSNTGTGMGNTGNTGMGGTGNTGNTGMGGTGNTGNTGGDFNSTL